MPSPKPRAPRQFAAPQLPPMTETTAVSYRHEVNPALATQLLGDLQVAVIKQQQQLRQVIRQIQALYAEGPVVDGWLESSAEAHSRAHTARPHHQRSHPKSNTEPTTGANLDPSALFRHGDVEDLMAYVQAMDPADANVMPGHPSKKTVPPPTTTSTSLTEVPTYHLCQLDNNGQVRSQLCPPQQVATVSMAIVRHQKLVKLVAKKTTLEAKLKQVVETLGDLKALLT